MKQVDGREGRKDFRWRKSGCDLQLPSLKGMTMDISTSESSDVTFVLKCGLPYNTIDLTWFHMICLRTFCLLPWIWKIQLIIIAFAGSIYKTRNVFCAFTASNSSISPAVSWAAPLGGDGALFMRCGVVSQCLRFALLSLDSRFISEFTRRNNSLLSSINHLEGSWS